MVLQSVLKISGKTSKCFALHVQASPHKGSAAAKKEAAAAKRRAAAAKAAKPRVNLDQLVFSKGVH